MTMTSNLRSYPKLDGCPNNLSAHRWLLVVPWKWEHVDGEGWRGDYVCPLCRHAWFTGWRVTETWTEPAPAFSWLPSWVSSRRPSTPTTTPGNHA